MATHRFYEGLLSRARRPTAHELTPQQFHDAVV